MDCEEPTQPIELVFTPMSLRKKEMLGFLAQQGLSDKEIYQEMGRIYGRHIVVNALCSDGSIDMKTHFVKNILIAQGIFGIGYFTLRFLKKKF